MLFLNINNLYRLAWYVFRCHLRHIFLVKLANASLLSLHETVEAAEIRTKKRAKIMVIINQVIQIFQDG
ncbi:MAG: hypothetical protein COC05_02180 [Gammaproteobacteria bacterium]|nr:MAG: hypothetical protein COC05_02180 [Gammaproteobacteria bacterium]